ncbi:MAG: transporter substrate-binding domain-containing protein [Campylobacteraceae bacterium]|nr:transporter substrate-binding domain-containing protein [Campylobacteraceae bacterium]
MVRFVILLTYILFFQSLHAQETIKVGIYNNAPKIFIDALGKPSGFFVEIFNEIAKDAQWKVDYIPCDWEECLVKLEAGEIDIMPDVAYTKEREMLFDFANEVVLSSWSIIYAKKNMNIHSILDLNAKRVAILKNSIQYIYLKEQATLFDINPIFIEVNNFKEALELHQANKVDIVVINNFYSDEYIKSSSIQKTNVFLNPVMLKFAFNKKLPSHLLETTDSLLKVYKKNENSTFYKAKQRWLEPDKENIFPLWINWAVGITALVFMILLGLVAFFRYLLNLKIKELKANEKILLMQSRNAAMGEMISMIAHQWKQPLTILSMIANNIKADMELGIFDAKSAGEYHQQLSNQIFYLSHTIDDFKDFFKPNKEKQFVKELHQVIENALNLLGKTFENNHITIYKEYNKVENLNIYVNELIQIIINLLKNSQEAFSQSTVENKYIIIRTYLKKNWITIEVEDNAGGIKEEILEKIFEPYFTTKEKLNGTGLGLYMSKSIIENHFGGTINVTCKGKISLFTVKFPIITEEA